MRKDRIVEITGLAILLIQRLYGKDYKNAVVTFYLLFVIAILDREITEENMIHQEIISVIAMLLIMGFFVLPMLVKLFRFWQAEKNKI